VILLCGIPTESPLAMVAERLRHAGLPFVVLSQRDFESSPFHYEIAAGRIEGELRTRGVRYQLGDVSAVYIRLMDDQQLPELANESAGSPRRQHARAWHDALTRWCEIAPIRVVTRVAAMASNASKPFQAHAILRHGFRIPDTLITSDPESVRAFAREHRRVVFKSTSGVRPMVRMLVEADMARLDRIRWCPVQFQAFVDGRNVRVHVIGSDVFATLISSDATDYRYAQRDGGEPATLEAVEISDDLADRCRALAADLDLPFAGIDLKVTPDDEVYCFEVNPSPAYSYYESQTGQPIARALASYLSDP
jgi:glutathione synthase/RimK-type ligase-like ATP-grasp enzyme